MCTGTKGKQNSVPDEGRALEWTFVEKGSFGGWRLSEWHKGGGKKNFMTARESSLAQRKGTSVIGESEVQTKSHIKGQIKTITRRQERDGTKWKVKLALEGASVGARPEGSFQKRPKRQRGASSS